MSSEELKNHLVDLLYDDELDDETRASMRREVEASDDTREELEEFEHMLGMIRESTEPEGPSESVHESIMDAAREQAENTTRERAAATGRAPRVPAGDDEQSIWGRISSHQVTQLALAACAILGAGFLFYLFNMQADQSAPQGMATAEETKFENAANEATTDEVSLDEKEVAQAETEPEESEESDKSWLFREERQDKAAASDETDELEEAPSSTRRRARRPRTKDSLAKKKAEGPVPKSRRSSKKSKPKLDQDDDGFDPFGGTASESDSRSNEVFGTRDSPKAEEQQQERGGRGKSAQDNAGVASSLGLSDESSEGEAEPQKQAAGEASPEPVAPTEEQMAGADSDDTAGTSVSDVESAYRSGKDKRVLSSADDIIDAPSASGSQIARALELKGLALRRLGRLQEADRTLARLQSEYPDYKPDFVQSARADIAKSEREEREAKRRKRRPSKDDEIDLMPETESSEPADAMDQAY